MKDHEDLSFITSPRQIKRDLVTGQLTPQQFFVLIYTRMSVNIYGIATISLDRVINDLDMSIKRNRCNQIVLNLKKKEYIHYPNRQGKKGSFEVHVQNILTPRGYKVFEFDEDGNFLRTNYKNFEEVRRLSDKGFEGQIKKFKQSINPEGKQDFQNSSGDRNRSPYKKKKNKNNKNKNTTKQRKDGNDDFSVDVDSPFDN